MCKFREIFFEIFHGDYFLTELVVLTNYRTFTMLTFSEKYLVKICHFVMFTLLIMLKQTPVS